MFSSYLPNLEWMHPPALHPDHKLLDWSNCGLNCVAPAASWCFIQHESRGTATERFVASYDVPNAAGAARGRSVPDFVQASAENMGMAVVSQTGLSSFRSRMSDLLGYAGPVDAPESEDANVVGTFYRTPIAATRNAAVA
jgi:hypothetical protein